MNRLMLGAGLIGLSSGCMSLDFMFLNAPTVDEYDFDPTEIPMENIEVVEFDRGDGKMLKGVWLRQSATLPSQPMIFFHGMSNNLEKDFERLEYYWSWGEYDVFAADYSGFGASEGDPTFENLIEYDGPAIFEYVIDRTGFQVDDIPVVGLSLGGFVAIHAADEYPPQAMVIESVFANSDLLLDGSLKLDVPPGWFFEEDWETDRAIQKVGQPIYVIHGKADDFIDPKSGKILYDNVPGDRELWQPEGVDHADLFQREPDEYRERSIEFFYRYFP